ncbi:MAG: ABC transporter substrate-binding protein [Proteobacteria bacterium]|nr:ABC transporter substrate-binding protein [Pseudomonadota bacterium]
MRSHIKRVPFLITFLAVFGLASASLSFTSVASAYPSKVVTPSDPTYIIQTALKKITTFSSNADKVSSVKLRGFIENEIIPHFDFDNMSHWITGRYARNMSEADKTDFQRSLRETFLSSLAKHLGSFDAKNTRVRFYPARYRGPDETFVSTSIYRPGIMPVRLDFRMRREDDTWRIIDVKANGSSAVLYYRRHFMSQLRQYKSTNRDPYGRPPRAR